MNTEVFDFEQLMGSLRLATDQPSELQLQHLTWTRQRVKPYDGHSGCSVTGRRQNGKQPLAEKPARKTVNGLVPPTSTGPYCCQTTAA
ncbi:hypothetical protein BIT28_14215 [Photobacterium proteolyticum]|uniref:Uncharacterized protein n=1 Tax=Photobacterium proteolyticum TaxID=1903952 RepID=A0A1Q9H1R5_9GAMM|nr:hypothetical protein [Photobacterium proteolyticum]OLQ81674.1 hypothetical protein BIT28_14215 [Photobacterium proteolyticum]